MRRLHDDRARRCRAASSSATSAARSPARSSPRDGAFALADGGTLFLDEVGELPLPLQAELLRVVQEGTTSASAATTGARTRFRLICATNRDLREEAAAGRFRRDLYYRIAGWSCRLPPLRERREDILLLASHFLRELRPGPSRRELDAAGRASSCWRATTPATCATCAISSRASATATSARAR